MSSDRVTDNSTTPTIHPPPALSWEYLCTETIQSTLPLCERIGHIARTLGSLHPEIYNLVYDKMSTKSKRSAKALAKRATLVGVGEGGVYQYRIEEVR